MSSTGFGLDVAPLRWFDLLAGDAQANDQDFSMDLLNWRDAAAQMQDPAVVRNTSVSAYIRRVWQIHMNAPPSRLFAWVSLDYLKVG
jgi:hypothetical protein